MKIFGNEEKPIRAPAPLHGSTIDRSNQTLRNICIVEVLKTQP